MLILPSSKPWKKAKSKTSSTFSSKKPSKSSATSVLTLPSFITSTELSFSPKSKPTWISSMQMVSQMLKKMMHLNSTMNATKTILSKAKMAPTIKILKRKKKSAMKSKKWKKQPLKMLKRPKKNPMTTINKYHMKQFCIKMIACRSRNWTTNSNKNWRITPISFKMPKKTKKKIWLTSKFATRTFRLLSTFTTANLKKWMKAKKVHWIVKNHKGTRFSFMDSLANFTQWIRSTMIPSKSSWL